MIEIDPASYLLFVVYERGLKTLYLVLHKAIYGMLTESLLWYRKFCSNLEKVGFKFNDFDSCVATRMIEGSQHTIRYHIDDIVLFNAINL